MHFSIHTLVTDTYTLELLPSASNIFPHLIMSTGVLGEAERGAYL